MPWGRLDDGLYDHPKVEKLPLRVRNSCVGLWARAISWSNRYLTDGCVSDERLAKLDGRPAEIDALVRVGMFERTHDGVLIHDFGEYNHTAEDVREKRALMRELGKRGGQASGRSRRCTATVERDGSSAAKRDGKRDGLNSRPDPSRTVENQGLTRPSTSGGARPIGLVDPVEERESSPSPESPSWMR